MDISDENNNNHLFDDSIDFYLPNDISDTPSHLHSNNENDEQQLDVFRSYLDKELFD